MLDPDDEQIIKDCKDGGCVLVTWDRVVRKEAGGLTPYEVMEKAPEEAPPEAPAEAKAEVNRLLRLTPEQLTIMADGADKTHQLFNKHIHLEVASARLIKQLRVEEDFSWRAVARWCAMRWKAPWGGNQIAGMVICEKAAKLLGEDFLKEPWN
mgnify:CR=1 FL=1